MIMPYINLLIEVLLVGLFQCMDSGCCCRKKKTGCKNYHQFMETYKGANFLDTLSY